MSFESDLLKDKFAPFNVEKNNLTEQTIEMPLSEYQSLNHQLNFLLQRCSSLERLLLFSDISSVPRVVHDFRAMSQFYLLQLAKEIESYRFCPDERAELIDFLDYLHSVTHEIEDLLLIEKE